MVCVLLCDGTNFNTITPRASPRQQERLFLEILNTTLQLITSGDATLWGIVALSLRISLSATLIAALLAIPLGTGLAMGRFLGRRVIIMLSSSLMALPPVVVGLAIYLLLSRAGPFGEYGLLFTPTAMIIAQMILIIPIIVSLSAQIIEEIQLEYKNLFKSLH